MLATRDLLLTFAMALFAAAPAAADDGPPEREPGARSTGKVYTWKAENDLAYDYYLPKGYDAEKGITLTFVLHGSNGWKGWGFGMHAAGEFRPDDFVVSPDGTTPNGQGGFNSLQSSADLKRFHELHQHLKKLVKVNATYVYGLSQGSFFAHYYAGQHGDEVQGIVAHGSNLWLGSGLKKANHGQAISVMHGVGDPVVGYANGVSAHAGYVENKYPLLRFRTLELDLHWAPWGHQAQQLAWCEGMTSPAAERVATNFSYLDGLKDNDGWLRDPVALYQVARRAAEMEGVDGKTQARATKCMAEIESLAEKHVAAILAAEKKTKGAVTKTATWPAHARYFLRDWRGVPAADEFAKAWEKTLDKHGDAAEDGRKDYYAALNKEKTAKAFSAAVGAIEKGFLHYWCADAGMLAQIAAWREDPKAAGISSAAIKRYDKVVAPFLEAAGKGKKEYASLNKKL